MPAKRARVHTSCVACGEPMPLAGLLTSVTCAACGNRGDLPLRAWRWVLEDEARTVASGELILGETQAGDVACAGCQEPLGEDALARASAAEATEVRCARCGVGTPMRVVGDHTFLGEGRENAVADSAGAIDVACSSCGAKLAVDGSTPTPTCAFCNTRNVLSRDVWERMHPPGRVHPFYVWTSPAVAARAARATRAPDVDSRSSDGAANKVVGVIGIVVALVAVIAGFAQTHKKKSPAIFVAPSSPCDGMQSACSTDKKSMLACENGKLVPALSCKGPKGCRPTDHGNSVSCDYTVADENDPCNVKDSACSTDGKSELRCDGSKFVLASPCSGADGCTVTPAKDGYTLTCDDHVAPPGAPCLEDGRFACASDGKSELRCARGHFVLAMTCKGASGCKVSKNRVDDTTTVACDGDLSDVGDPCRPGDHACTLDGKSLLACKDGVFAVDRACRRSCGPTPTGLECR